MGTSLLKKVGVIPCDVRDKHFIGDVLIEGDRIKKIGRDLPASGADQVIDLEGCTLLPGFIDLHVHLTFRRTVGPITDTLRQGDGLNIIRSVRNALTLLRQGVTTIRETGSSNNISLIIREAISRKIMPGPRMLVAGTPVTITGGHSYTAMQCSGRDEFQKTVRTLINKGVDWVKTFGSNDPLESPVDGEYTRPEVTIPELEVVVSAARHFGRKVAVHTMGSKCIRAVAGLGVNSIEHGIYLDEEGADVMIRNNVALVPTLSGYYETTLPRWNRGEKWRQHHQNLVEPHKESFKTALKKGVFIALGTDSAGELLQELRLMTQYGMPVSEALRAGTIHAATVLGLQGQIGTIEPGKIADLVALRGDVLADLESIRNPVCIVQGGRVFRPGDIRLPSGDESGDSEPGAAKIT
jgi:imidazolonepropionase-like amidohydrolase